MTQPAPTLAGQAAEIPRLDSWKEIAAYLRRGVRTVQRWEREEALPVHRHQHEKLGSVYAYRHELDAWFAGRRSQLASEPETRPSDPSVAVLPFADLSPAGDHAYLCDGIAEEIVHALNRVKGLRTASRTASFRFRDPAMPSREIGRELGVETLLEGSVRKAGDLLRIAVRLVEAETGFQLWAHRYDGTERDIFDIQDKIAESVANALIVALQPAGRAPAAASTGAHECYLRGRQYFYQYHPRAMEFAIRMFVRAIELDPNYVQAYAGLADCWCFNYLYAGGGEAVREQAEWASLKAQQIDPRSAQAQASRGMVLSLFGRTMEADHAFDLALQQDPELYEALFFRARHCFIAGRRAEASDYYRRAMKSRPDDYQCPLLAAPIEDELGRPESAAALRSAGIALAERHLQLNPDDARALYLSAAGWAAQGDHRARPFAERAREMRPDDPVLLYHVGCVLAALNQLEPAIDCLEEAARLGFAQKAWYENDGSLNPLRQYSRFQAVLDSLT